MRQYAVSVYTLSVDIRRAWTVLLLVLLLSWRVISGDHFLSGYEA